MKTKEILFSLDLPSKTRQRINGHGIYTFTTDVKVPKNFMGAIISSSEFSKKNKLMLYGDIVKTGPVNVYMIHLSPYPVDLAEGDHIGDFTYIPSRCTDNCNCNLEK